MEYIIEVLEEQKQLIQEKHKQTHQLIEMYEKHIDKLKDENLDELIKLADIQEKIYHIKYEEMENNPSN